MFPSIRSPSFSVFLSSPVFFLFPCFFFSLPFGPLFLPWLSPFYNELIQWDFSLLPLGIHQLFLVYCGHPFKITHSPIGYPDHCHCSIHVCYTTIHFMTKFPFVCSCCIPLPHYLALWHASDGLNHLLLLFGKISSSQDIFPKRIHGRKPNIDPLFPLTTKPRPLNPLNCGPTSLVLARYRLVVLQPFCACSTVFCVCLPRCFYCSRLVLFRYAACFILFLRVFLATFVIFLWFGFSSLHMIPTADASCHSLFLFIVLLHISFHTYPFTQNNLGRCGPDNVDWIKRVLGPICLCLPEPFCQGTVLCGRSVFCGRFAFCYRYLYTKGFEKGLGPNLSSSAKAILPGNCILRQICILLQIPFPCTSFFGPFLLFGLLGRPLGLAFHWAFLRMGFWIRIRKNGHQQIS